MTVASPEPLDSGGLQRRAVQGALWTGIHTLVSLPLAFVVNILVAQILGVTDYGRLAYLNTVILIASVIAGMGVTTALIQFGAKAHASGNTAEVQRLLSGSQGFRLIVSGPIIAVAVLAIVQVDWWLLALAVTFGVGAPALLGNANPALTIENRTDRAAQITMVGNFALQLSIVWTVLTYGTPDAVWSARIVVSGLLLALPLAAISRQYRSAVLRPGLPWKLPRAFWAFAVPTGMAGVIGVLVAERTEVILLDWLADERAMGLFGLAFGLAGHLYAPAQAFIGPLVPAVSALSAIAEDSVQRAFLRTTRSSSAVGGMLVAAALPALACLVPVLYGRDFTEARDLLVIVGVGSAIMLISSPHQAFLMARLGGRRMLWINVVSLAANITLAVVLIPFFGAMGAAIASAGAFVARALQLTAGEARALKIPVRSLVHSFGAMLLALGIAVILWLVARQAEISDIALAGILGLSGLVLYVTLLKVLRLGLTAADAGAITRSLPKPLQPVGKAMLAILRGSVATK